MNLSRPLLSLLALLFTSIVFANPVRPFSAAIIGQVEPPISSLSAAVLQSSSGVTASRLSAPRIAPPPVTAAPVLPAAPAQTPIEGADKIKFVLRKVIIEGNTVYCTERLLAYAQPYINKEISVSTLQTITQEITTKYRNDGYILSHATLPAQSIQNGIVHIKVLEGFIDHVTVTDQCDIKNYGLLQAYGNRIKACRPLQMKVLERYILLANDLPGESVKAVITPSKTTQNAAELSLVATHKVYDATVMYDNYSTTFLGPEEFTYILHANSFFSAGDRTNVQSVMSQNPKELRFIEVSHSMPLNNNGLNFLMGGNYTETNPEAIISPLFVQGHTYTFFGSLNEPLIRSRSKNLNLYAAANYQTTFANILDTPLYTDRIRSLEAGFFFDLADSWKGYNTLFFKGEKGFDIFGADQEGDLARINGQSKYGKLNAEASRTQYLNPNISIYVAGKGQYSWEPLLPEEQFYFGGPDYGRAYDPAIILGDKGIAGKGELRVDTTPPIQHVRNIQYYVFYDAGIIWNYFTPGLVTHADATCWGGGARLYFTKYFSGNIYLAKPLVKPAPDAIATSLNVTSSRIFFQARIDL